MSKARDRSNARLRQWLAEMLGLRTVLVTSAAPVLPSEKPEDDLALKLERLDRSLSVAELSFATDLRYAATPEPQALRLLRRHEGAPPGCPAVLCPESPQTFGRLVDIAANCGLQTALPHPGPAAPVSADALPVSFHRMRRVEVLDGEAGLVRIQRGARWEDIAEAGASHGFGKPRGMEAVFATPADAALAGVFAARPADLVRGVACSFEMVLPVAGTTMLDGIWLFRNEKKARAAFLAVCRKVPPLYAELIGHGDLKIGERLGLWRLPERPWRSNTFTGLRLAYLGGPMAARVQRFLSTWQVEGRGGKIWRNGPLLDEADRVMLVLENGLTEITLPGTQEAAGRLTRAATEAAGDGITPIVTARHRFSQGRFCGETSVILPRDFSAPISQWKSIFASASGLASAADPPPPGPDDRPTEESDEWQAIRAALMPDQKTPDEQGQQAPMGGQAATGRP